jgi:hypothetical protein
MGMVRVTALYFDRELLVPITGGIDEMSFVAPLLSQRLYLPRLKQQHAREDFTFLSHFPKLCPPDEEITNRDGPAQTVWLLLLLIFVSTVQIPGVWKN